MIGDNLPAVIYYPLEKISTKNELEVISTFAKDSDVKFAHIESVVVNPFKALDLDNGVIILKNIHANLTRLNIHTFEQLYLFCKENHYSTDWANY